MCQGSSHVAYMEGEGKLNICTRMHPDRSWWVVLHTRTRLTRRRVQHCCIAFANSCEKAAVHFDTRFKTVLQGNDGYIVDHRYQISQMPFARCWRLFQNIPAILPLFNFSIPCCWHWPLICQELLMDPWTLYEHCRRHHLCILIPESKSFSGWVKVTKVTEIWECCSFQLWMIQGTRRKLPSLDGAVSPRRGDEGYIINRRYHISQIPFVSFWRLF